jgi:8-oxo-dGTP pyrophosphatase MutT (NUDIX family)
VSELPVRDIARALVFDPRDRLLLIAYEAMRDVDPSRPALRKFWFLPGGGIEEGESDEEALRRELDEEIGVRDFALGPWVARCEGPFVLFRKARFGRERYAVVRLPDDRIDTARLAETEDNPILGVHWWTLDELEHTDDVVEPPGLAALAARVLRGDIPDEPARLGFGPAARGEA